jgi:hypothetical protein
VIDRLGNTYHITTKRRIRRVAENDLALWRYVPSRPLRDPHPFAVREQALSERISDLTRAEEHV